ncbi:phosphoglucomutase/phosphomannomutase family protein [bacterium]|nr:phosphoglucomutase/phosphomannomutase family protein [bacterium]
MERIKFGTDGWRGVISEDFTFENVKIVSQAMADYLREKKIGKREIIIGYDARFLSKEYARLVASVLTGNGIRVILSDRIQPVPCVCFVIKDKKAAGGIMITASHNPFKYNGIKFKGEYAGSADEATTKRIEGFLYKNKPKEMDFEASQRIDLTPPYLQFLKSFVNLEAIKEAPLKVVVDSMHGAGKDYTAQILKGGKCQVITIRGEENPSFGGVNPEPILENLKALMDKIKEEKADVGLATDGDGDRLGVMDNKGNFVNPHQVLSLLTLHLIESRGWSGGIVKTISTTSLLNKIAEKHKRRIYKTPVGFKYICELMLKEDILIGGEESGGIGVKNHVPDRDGLLSGLLLLEMIALKKKPLSQIQEEMRKEFGTYLFQRIDSEYPVDKRDILIPTLRKKPPKELADIKVKEIDASDGIKFILEDNSWLLFRTSGTEPIIRIYAESDEKEKLEKIMEAGKELAFSI